MDYSRDERRRNMTPRSEPLLVAVALGSNLAPVRRTPFDLDPPADPRARSLEGALVLLRASGHSVVAASPLYETRPEGDGATGQPPFLNACVLLRTSATPQELLADCERIEREAGRSSKGDGAARPLDLDLVAGWRAAAEGATPLEPLATEGLVLPHPRMTSRSFVLVPLVGVAPEAPILLPGRPPRTAWALLRELAKDPDASLRPGPPSASFPSRPSPDSLSD